MPTLENCLALRLETPRVVVVPGLHCACPKPAGSACLAVLVLIYVWNNGQLITDGIHISNRLLSRE